MADIPVLIDLDVRLVVKNGFVDVPDLLTGYRISLNDALDTISGSTLKVIDGREYFVLPEFERTNGYPHDYFAMLRTAATSYLP